jgi:hypothetical protein
MIIGLLDDYWVVWVVDSLSFESDVLTHSLTHLQSLTCTLSLVLSHSYSSNQVYIVAMEQPTDTLTHLLTHFLLFTCTGHTHTHTHTHTNK